MTKERIYEKIKKNEKILAFAYYFFLDQNAYVDFKTNLLFLKKLNKNFNFLNKTTNTIFNAKIEINKNIFFNITKYVSANSGKIFNIKFCMFGKEFAGYKEIFNLLNLTKFAKKYEIFSSNVNMDERVKRRIKRLILLNKKNNRKLFNSIKKARAEHEKRRAEKKIIIPFKGW